MEKIDWDTAINYHIKDVPYIWSPSLKWEKCRRVYIFNFDFTEETLNEIYSMFEKFQDKINEIDCSQSNHVLGYFNMLTNIHPNRNYFFNNITTITKLLLIIGGNIKDDLGNIVGKIELRMNGKTISNKHSPDNLKKNTLPSYEKLVAYHNLPFSSIDSLSIYSISGLKNPKNIPSGLFYFENAISPDFGKRIEEWFSSDYFLERLKKVKNTQGISSEKARQVVQFGYEYDYTSRAAVKKIEDFPEIIKEILNVIPEVWINAPSNIKEKLNQCLINRYLPGQGIGPHIDKVEFGDVIVCFTFGSGREMVFTFQNMQYTIRTEPLSMYVMTGDARYKWKHEMKQKKSDNGIPRGTVYSITFREIIL